MVYIGASCLFHNTDLHQKLKELIPIINIEVGAKNGRPTFRQVRRELIKQTGVEIDLDTFADIYKSEIPSDLRFTTDEEIDDILNATTKNALDKLAFGMVDRLDGIGETSIERAAINKAASILATIEGKDRSTRTKTIARIIKDAVLAQISRLANSNPDFAAMKRRPAKETYADTLARVLEINSLSIPQTDADKFNTVQDIFSAAKDKVMNALENLRDEDGNEIMAEEGERFLEQYKDAFFGVLMSTADANNLLRGALLDAGYGKGVAGRQVVDWNSLAGTVNNPDIVRDNVIGALTDKQGLSTETATSIANALANEFEAHVRGEKAMKVKYALAEAKARDIMEKLGWEPTVAFSEKVNTELHEAIDDQVNMSDELDIEKVVHDVLLNNGANERQLANIPKSKMRVDIHTVSRVANLVKGDLELDADALAELYGIIGKAIDADAIADLRRIANLKDQIDNMELLIRTDGTAQPATKQGLEKAKLIQELSNQMARIVAKSRDYSGQTTFQRFLTYALNGLSKYIPANAALVLLNPFNITQNILSGLFAGFHGKVGGAITSAAGYTSTPLTFKTSDGETVKLHELLGKFNMAETWFNTMVGAEGRDIPDLFTGDPSKDPVTLKNASTKGEMAEAILTLMPRAALTATDAMVKEPYYRKELIRGVLYYLQKAGGMTRQQAQSTVYEALTRNSPERLAAQAKELATLVGKGNDKYYIKQVAEDIQMASLVILHPDTGVPILSQDRLQAIIDAAKQTSAEVFGHRIQKNVLFFNFFYDILTGAKAKAIESMNRDYGQKMEDLYKRGEYFAAAKLNFVHQLKGTMGFLFQRGIYNWAILMAQKNPVSIINGFRQLSKQVQFNDQKESRDAVENYLRSRAKIGRGLMGTMSAALIAPMVLEFLKGSDDEDKKKFLDKLRKDPVWGRLFKNFVSPLAQAMIDAKLSDTAIEGAGAAMKDMGIAPIVSAGARYYAVDNQIMVALDNLEPSKLPKAEAAAGGVLGMFLPGKSFLSTNKAWVERVGANSPELIGENYQIVLDSRKMPKSDDFWDAFWYSSLLKNPKK